MGSMMTPGMWRPPFSLALARWRVRVGTTETFFPPKWVRHRTFLPLISLPPNHSPFTPCSPSHQPLTLSSFSLRACATHKLAPLCESSQRKVTQIGPSRPAKRVRCFTRRTITRSLAPALLSRCARQTARKDYTFPTIISIPQVTFFVKCHSIAHSPK